jgi:hypothetical protein
MIGAATETREDAVLEEFTHASISFAVYNELSVWFSGKSAGKAGDLTVLRKLIDPDLLVVPPDTQAADV